MVTVMALWSSVRPVRKTGLMPTERSLLYSLFVSGSAGALPSSTYALKLVALKGVALRTHVYEDRLMADSTISATSNYAYRRKMCNLDCGPSGQMAKWMSYMHGLQYVLWMNENDDK